MVVDSMHAHAECSRYPGYPVLGDHSTLVSPALTTAPTLCKFLIAQAYLFGLGIEQKPPWRLVEG